MPWAAPAAAMLPRRPVPVACAGESGGRLLPMEATTRCKAGTHTLTAAQFKQMNREEARMSWDLKMALQTAVGLLIEPLG